MNEAPFSILLCTNGHDTTRPSLDYGIWLAGLLQVPVTLLGVVEMPEDANLVNQIMDEITQDLTRDQISYQTEIREGRGPVIISRVACSGTYLTVLGPLGRPAWHRVLRGRSYRRVLEQVCDPVLYVRQKHETLKRILICLGGLAYTEGLLALSLHLAQAAQASITLLHIVEPVTLHYPTALEAQKHWNHLEDTDNLLGKNLRKALATSLATGLPVQSKARHGNIVHEIIEEVREGGYDLVGMGSPYSSHSLRHLYMPNVTAEVAEGVHCPILAVRQGHALIKES